MLLVGLTVICSGRSSSPTALVIKGSVPALPDFSLGLNPNRVRHRHEGRDDGVGRKRQPPAMAFIGGSFHKSRMAS